MALSAVGLQTHIWNNKITSVLLLMGFPILLLLMLFGFFAGLSLTGQIGMAYRPPLQAGIDGVMNYGHFAFIGAAIWFAIAWWRHQAMINKATGAKPVTRSEQPKIYNMLENLCISRGLTSPKLYIIDSPALNAYASGLSQKSYAVTLTQGLIDTLDDDELEAVIAHELTHIINEDVRLLIISVIFVGMISFFAESAGRSMMYGGRSLRGYGRRRGGGSAAMIVALVILAIGYIFSIVIRFALSRRREFLADAGATELTKNPDAMISALRKISTNSELKKAPDDMRQMFIENKSKFMGLFATHPPISKRIEALVDLGGNDYTPVMPTPDGKHFTKGPWERREGPWS